MGSHQEIIIDILSKLPVKRFKCVSKSWNTSISEHSFKKKHLNSHAKNKNSPKLLISREYNRRNFYFYSSSLSSPSKLVDCPSSFNPIPSRVYCCCDGLFFIGIWPTKNEAEPSILLLWNPSTGESLILPRHVEIPPGEEYIYGLGYDSSSDDYKILRIDTNDEIHDEILALKSGSWRKIEETSSRMSLTNISDRELCLAFVHGAFHWIGACPRDCVVSFNISNEMYGEILLPKVPPSGRLNVEVGVSVLEGKFSFYHKNEGFDIWVLKDYDVKESWMKWITIPSCEVVRDSVIIPIYRFSDDEVLLSCFNLKGVVYRTYNISLELFNRIWPLHCDDINARSIQDGLVYAESLISPKSLNIM